jgi:hypothetical protein
MYISSFKQPMEYERVSKNGHVHKYLRVKTMNLFRCDSCDAEFQRSQAKMDPRRISNSFFHVCADCDAKRFAQKKGVEKRIIWDLPASSTLPIGKY